MSRLEILLDDLSALQTRQRAESACAVLDVIAQAVSDGESITAENLEKALEDELANVNDEYGEDGE